MLVAATAVNIRIDMRFRFILFCGIFAAHTSCTVSHVDGKRFMLCIFIIHHMINKVRRWVWIYRRPHAATINLINALRYVVGCTVFHKSSCMFWVLIGSLRANKREQWMPLLPLRGNLPTTITCMQGMLGGQCNLFVVCIAHSTRYVATPMWHIYGL